jgi:hypothetical protein
VIAIGADIAGYDASRAAVLGSLGIYGPCLGGVAHV